MGYASRLQDFIEEYYITNISGECVNYTQREIELLIQHQIGKDDLPKYLSQKAIQDGLMEQHPSGLHFTKAGDEFLINHLQDNT